MKNYLWLAVVLLVGCSATNKAQMEKPWAKTDVNTGLVNVRTLTSDDVWPTTYLDESDHYSTKFYYEHKQQPDMTFTKFGRYKVSSGRNTVPSKSVSGELASTMQYWMINEVRRIFLSKDFGGYTRHPYRLARYDVIDYAPFPHYKHEEVREVLREAGVDVPDAHLESTRRLCESIISGKKEGEYGFDMAVSSCSREYSILLNVRGFLPKTEKRLKAYERLYVGANKFRSAKIFEHIVYDTGQYDGKFIEHVMGKHSVTIRDSLMNWDFKRNEIWVNYGFLMDHQKHMFDEPLFSEAIPANAQILSRLFDINNFQLAYNNHATRTNTIMGSTAYDPHYTHKMFKRFPAKCKMNKDNFIFAKWPSLTRIDLNCNNDPILKSEKEWEADKEGFVTYNHYKDIHTYEAHSDSKDKPKKYANSNVTYYHFDESGIQKRKGLINGENKGDRNTVFLKIQYKKRNHLHYKKHKNFPQSRVYFDHFREVNMSQQAMALLKDLPPSAMVSWIDISSLKASYAKKDGKIDPARTDGFSNYVYHHGILWEFPLADFERLVNFESEK